MAHEIITRCGRDLMNNESTQNIVPIKDATVDVREIIGEVYDALTEKGYNPVSQVVGYIMSGDPTYITSYKNARSLIMKVERDEIIEVLLEDYIKNNLV